MYICINPNKLTKKTLKKYNKLTEKRDVRNIEQIV